MKYLLDTNTCIQYLTLRSDQLIKKIEQIDAHDIALCSVVRAELFFGAMRSTHPEKTLADQLLFLSRFPSLPFDDSAAERYGKIRAELANLGTPIGPNDLLIAAIALANNLTLVTHNTREFGRVTGLKIDDWEVS